MNESAERSDPTLELAVAMLRRRDHIELGHEAFRRAYPEAPDQMILAANFHVYIDGVSAIAHWLADLEQFLRASEHKLSVGWTGEVIHHLYNWLQLHSIMPLGKSGVLEMLDDISEFADDGDIEAIEATVEQLKQQFDGEDTAPDFH